MLWKEAVLPELLNTIVTLQKEEILEDFILAGGTALALQIGHRESYDVDLFSQKELENKKILDYLLKNYSGSHTIGRVAWKIPRILLAIMCILSTSPWGK